MFFKTFGGGGKLDVLSFTTKFRIPTSKVNLSPLTLCGCAAAPCLAETTCLQVPAQPRYCKDR